MYRIIQTSRLQYLLESGFYMENFHNFHLQFEDIAFDYHIIYEAAFHTHDSNACFISILDC